MITASNSFIASTAVIIHLGAKPVFIDVKNDQNIDENLIESKITSKTKSNNASPFNWKSMFYG